MREVGVCLGHTETTPGIESGEIALGLEGFGVNVQKGDNQRTLSGIRAA